MTYDLKIAGVSVAGWAVPVDILAQGDRIAAIGPAISDRASNTVDGTGLFAFPGFVDSHVHLDKACILDRCQISAGDVTEAIRETAKAKAAFTEDDVYARGARVLDRAITAGTTRMRSFVEVDPRAGYRSLAALTRLRADYAFALDLQICAFAQEGLTNEPATIDMLRRALSEGADMVGGCPYADPDPARHVAIVFDLAQEFGVDADFHLDFDLDPAHTSLPEVLAETRARGWGGRVSIGHVTNLSAMAPERVSQIAAELAEAGIALTVLPATDMFLTGRSQDRLIPRGVAPAHRLRAMGVTASIATNNVMNPFTPYGDAALLRMANLYANVQQLAREADIAAAFAMVTTDAARILKGAPYALRPGAAADIVLIEARTPEQAVRENVRVVMGWKNGRQSFDNGHSRIFRPA